MRLGMDLLSVAAWNDAEAMRTAAAPSDSSATPTPQSAGDAAHPTSIVGSGGRAREPVGAADAGVGSASRVEDWAMDGPEARSSSGGKGGSCWVLLENQLMFAREGGSSAERGSEAGAGADAVERKSLMRSHAVKSCWRVKGVYPSRLDAVQQGHTLWLSQYGPENGWNQCSQIQDGVSPTAAGSRTFSPSATVGGETVAHGAQGGHDAATEGAGAAGSVSGATEAREGATEEDMSSSQEGRDMSEEGGSKKGGKELQGEEANSGFLWAAELSGVDLSAGGGAGGHGAGGAGYRNMYDLYVEFSVQESDFGGSAPALF